MRSALLGIMTAALLAAPAAAQPVDFNRAVRSGIDVWNTINRSQQTQRQHRQPQYLPRQERQAQPISPRLARSDVAEIQQRLRELGYDPGPIDGAEGPKTRAALLEFERANGLAAEGRLTRERLAILRVASGGAASQQQPQASASSFNSEESRHVPSDSPWDAMAATDDASLSSTQSRSLRSEQRTGYLFVEGRLAVEVGSSVPGSGKIALPTPVALTQNLGEALFRLVGPSLRERPLDERTALGLIPAFDESTQRAIQEEAFERPWSEVSRHEQFSFPTNSSPFVKRRAAEGVRARLHQLFSGEALEQPIPLRVYCSAKVLSYDFATEAFPIAEPNCLAQPGVIFPGLRGSTVPGIRWIHEALPAPQDGFPAGVPIAAHEAEAFDDALPRSRLVLLSYESELSVDIRLSEAAPIATVSYAAPRNFVLHPNNQWAEVLFALKSGRTPAIASGSDRTWHLYNQDDLAELVRLADPPRALPASAHSLAAAEGGRLGFLTLFGGQCLRPSRGGQVEVNPLGRSGSALAAALAAPDEHLVSLPSAAGGSSPLELFGLLMQPKHAFTFSAPTDLYGEYCLDAELEAELVGVHQFALPDGKSALVLTIIPREGRFLGNATHSRGRTKQVLERIPFSGPAEFPHFEAITVPSRAGLLWNLAERFAADGAAVIQNDLSRAGVSDPFEQRRRVDELIEAARIENASVDRFWLQGTLSLKNYDFASQSFPVAEITLQTIDVLRAMDVRNRTLRFDLRDPQEMAVPMPPQEAEGFAQHRLRNLPVRMLVRPTRGQVSSYGDLRVRVELEEAEILAPDATITLMDPAQVLYRYPFEARPEALERPPAGALSREEAETRLTRLLEDLEATSIMARRSSAEEVTAALTSSYRLASGAYSKMLVEHALEMPNQVKYLHPEEVTEAFEANSGAVILIDTEPLRVLSEEREQVLTLMTRHDLVLGSFPPAVMFSDAERRYLTVALPENAEHLVVRRRDDAGPVRRGLAEKSVAADYYLGLVKVMPFQANLEATGAQIVPDLPQEKDIAELAELPRFLREETGVSVVLRKEGFTRIYPKISDLDLVVRRFPPEEFYVGLRKDNTQEPHEFAVLGMAAGAASVEVEEAIRSEFASAEISSEEAGSLTASRGLCDHERWNAAGSPDEVGSLCLKVRFEEGRAVHIALRQVISGDVKESALRSFRQRYHRDHWLREIRHLEKGATRSVYGWGTLLNAERAALGRVDAKTPTSALEAVLWLADGATTIQLHLDAVQTLAEAEQAKMPEIKF